MSAAPAQSLHALIEDALPLLMRGPVLDAVVAAQLIAGQPVTAHEARTARPVTRHARAFTALAWSISRLGPDEQGRQLCSAGRDRKGYALWWVEQRRVRGPEA